MSEVATTGQGQFLVRASGGVGIGTNMPAGELHVAGGSGDVDVFIEADTEDAAEDDNPMLRFRQDGGLTGMNLGFDETNLGSNIFGIGRRVSNVDYHDTFVIEAASGDVGIGTQVLSNRLHVVEDVNGSGGNEVNYVTWIESPNTGNNPDILALGAGTASPGDGVNYIGFFAAGNLIGQIEGGGSSVVYNTMGADYAELLPRAAAASDIEVGSIVGVRDGQVALDTQAAQRVMVVTDRPAVLGNAQPGEDASEGFEPIAFIGQVPVKVRGIVEAGDYIVPSGQHNGIGWAVSPQDLRVADLGKVVGVAWESSDDPALKKIIVEVGLDRAAAAAHAFEGKFKTLEERIAELERLIGS